MIYACMCIYIHTLIIYICIYTHIKLTETNVLHHHQESSVLVRETIMARNWDACKSCSFELSWTSCKEMKGLHTSITSPHLLWKRRSRTSNLCDILGERRIPSCACPKSGNPVVYHHFPTLTWQQACAGGIHALKPNALHVDGTSSKWSQ